uniref:Glycosyltransferase 2-like domain-containing protein n=1 Tax=viral metagenome TaxID=1070528 RepID=A0A6C0CN71_9ZZZZ
MGKNNNKNKKRKPFVSICTPTFNRRPFISTMFQCFQNQTYPKDRMEWIIVDDGTDKIEDLVQSSNIPQIQYFKVDEKMTLGAKRNMIHSKTKGSILVYMDDDDYYPPERVQHAVETLQKNPSALCVGSSEIYVYFKHISTMYKGGPYGPNHATAGTFAFRRELLDQTKFNEKACLAEEKEFLKNYTIPFAQLDPLKTILVFSHVQNTFDKKRLLETPNPSFIPCDRKIEEFIKHDFEINIKNYFMKNIDKELEKYKPGNPKMKPDVIKQTEELRVEREKMKQDMIQKQMAQGGGGGQIMVQGPDGKQRPLSTQEIVQLLDKQNKEIQERNQKLQMHDSMLQYSKNEIEQLKSQIEELQEEIFELKHVKKTQSTNTNTNANEPFDPPDPEFLEMEDLENIEVPVLNIIDVPS